jgi:hypothetical protein
MGDEERERMAQRNPFQKSKTLSDSSQKLLQENQIYIRVALISFTFRN